MKFRLILTFLSFFLALAVSADRTPAPCRGCWVAFPDAPPFDQSFGVNIHFTEPQPGEMQLIADAGFRWARTDFKWDATERERGHYDFAVYDGLVNALEPVGMRALFILDYGNPLYGDGAPRSDAAQKAFARWAVAAAERFANRGVVWEIYNEPNNSMFWKPPDARQYASLALLVGRAFREAVPNEKLIGPAIGEMDFRFLKSAFAAGTLDIWSAVSVHPYLRREPEAVAPEYAQLRQMIRNYRKGNDKPNLPIISSEWGYSSVWRGMNDEQQANVLARQFLTNAANGIPISIWYDWRDDGTDPKDPEHHFGLVRNEYRSGQTPVFELKPAYLAARALIQQFAGYRFEQRLKVGGEDDYVLVFTKGGEPRIAAWTTSTTSAELTLPLANGDWAVTKTNGEAAATVRPGEQGLIIKITSAPIYLARVK